MLAEFNAAFSLGRQQLIQENWTGAVAALQRAVSIRPDAWAIRGLLGVACLQAGQPEEAIEQLQRTLIEKPDDVPARLHLGIALFSIGQLAACEVAMRAVTVRRPTDVVAWRHLIASREGRGLPALQAWLRLSRLLPADPTVWAGLGGAWMTKGAPQQAITCFRTVLSLQPNNLAARCRLGMLLIDVGEIDEAEQALKAVLQEVPDSTSAITALARIRSWRRDEDGARALIAPLIQLDPPPVEAAALWAELHRNRPAEACLVVEAALASSRTNAQRSLLLHRLGDLYDVSGEHDAAFAAWQEANHIRGSRFDPAAHERVIDTLIAAYSHQQVRSDCGSTTPVFVVGMPRSGTSLLEQMLDRHPDIVGAGELESIRRIAAHLSRPVDYHLGLDQITAVELADLAGAHLQMLHRIGGSASVVVDKMPNNFLHLGLISQLFPRARVLHCVRDPVDTCFSCFRQRFGAGLPHTTRLEWLGAYHQGYSRLMAHWEASLPIRIHRVRYEDLVRTPEKTMRSVLSVVGVAWDGRCLSPHHNSRTVTTASRQQVQQPLYTHAIGRADPYREHLAVLRGALGDEV